jgi:hypothetical protein
MRRFLLKCEASASGGPGPSHRWTAIALLVTVGCITLKDGNARVPDDHDGSLPGTTSVEQPDGLPAESEWATSNDASDANDAAANRDTGTEPIDAFDGGNASDGGHASDGRSDVAAFDAADGLGPLDATPDAASDGAPPPLLVAPTHLRLWLTADRGVTCTSGRVVKWADQSGAKDDATLRQNQLGPQCQLSPDPHSINGTDVPYFSAPTSGSNPNVIDETLDVDLGFLAGGYYSLFVVERRTADYDAGTGAGQEVFLGTTVADETNPTCQANTALAFGYVYYYGPVQLDLEQNCNGTSASVHGVPPIAIKQDTAVFGPWGHGVWVNGNLLVVNSSTAALSLATKGAIGRGIAATTTGGTDWRFRGDIAEVLVYDTALGDVDRLSVEAYLKNHWRY